jgi:hypothetical protein
MRHTSIFFLDENLEANTQAIASPTNGRNTCFFAVAKLRTKRKSEGPIEGMAAAQND